MKILITGGSGLVGRYVVDHLLVRWDVDVLDIVVPHRRDIAFLQADILDFRKLVPLLKGYDAVVHLAAIPHPLSEPAERVFRVNTMGTFNLLEACALNRINRFVFMSSESTLGFAFSTRRVWPEYLPIDEEHPLQPQDPYGVSKVCGEQLCASYTRRTGMQTVCLRPPWIWIPEEKEVAIYRNLVQQYDRWYKNLWAYIHVADVAEAVERSLQQPQGAKHAVYFICAKENWTSLESRSLAARFYPETTQIAESFQGCDSFISHARAGSELGFVPKFSARDILGEL
jgi:UDP-glucose 4-epimerase